MEMSTSLKTQRTTDEKLQKELRELPCPGRQPPITTPVSV